MSSWQDIAEAIGGALVLGWGVFVEWRLHQTQNSTIQLRRALNDKIIQDATHAESDSDLRAELSREAKG